MPVREALSWITHSGVLTAVSGRTLGVPILSVEDLKELYRVRLEIGGTAVEWALQRRTELFVITFQEVLVDLDDAAKRSDNKAFIVGNYQFHEAIYQQSRSEILQGIIKTLWLMVSP
jgi:DNA-binding GntR family transcriptional regulator